MGHFHTTVEGRGKNRQEAQRDAVQSFLHENGHRHSVYDVSKPQLVRKIPPMKWVEKKSYGLNDWGRHQSFTTLCQEPDPAAPPDQWVEEWSFELHTHA